MSHSCFHSPLMLSVKRGLIRVVGVGGIVAASILVWKLATLPPTPTNEAIFPRIELVVGPIMSPLGPQLFKPY
jgi:Fe2+ transport system protein B